MSSGAVAELFCELRSAAGSDEFSELTELIELCGFEFSTAEELPPVFPQAVSESVKAAVNIATDLFIRTPLISAAL